MINNNSNQLTQLYPLVKLIKLTNKLLIKTRLKDLHLLVKIIRQKARMKIIIKKNICPKCKLPINIGLSNSECSVK